MRKEQYFKIQKFGFTIQAIILLIADSKKSGEFNIVDRLPKYFKRFRIYLELKFRIVLQIQDFNHVFASVPLSWCLFVDSKGEIKNTIFKDQTLF